MTAPSEISIGEAMARVERDGIPEVLSLALQVLQGAWQDYVRQLRKARRDGELLIPRVSGPGFKIVFNFSRDREVTVDGTTLSPCAVGFWTYGRCVGACHLFGIAPMAILLDPKTPKARRPERARAIEDELITLMEAEVARLEGRVQ